MLDSILDACEQINENTTNMKKPSNHALWKRAVASSELDFDWAAWIVLGTAYYDPIAKSTKPEDTKFKDGFLTNRATKKIQERYNCEKIFTDQLPTNISPPRPLEWGNVKTKPPKDNDAVGRPRSFREPRTPKRKAGLDIPDDEEDQANNRHQSNGDQVKKPPGSGTAQAILQYIEDDSGTDEELVGLLCNHLKQPGHDRYDILKKDDRAYPPQLS